MMTIDIGQKESQNPERSRIAFDAEKKLLDEIVNLKDEEITPDNATYIAGVFLARYMEGTYLLSHQDDQPDIGWKKWTGRNHEALTLAREGDFKPLREFTEGQSNMYEALSHDLGQKSDDEKRHNKEISAKLSVLAERIPDSGDGNAVKIPNPVLMEDPVPLRIQLERFAAGEEIR